MISDPIVFILLSPEEIEFPPELLSLPHCEQNLCSTKSSLPQLETKHSPTTPYEYNATLSGKKLLATLERSDKSQQFFVHLKALLGIFNRS